MEGRGAEHMKALIEKTVQGDVEAFLELMEKHSLTMYKVARAILNNDVEVKNMADSNSNQ